MEIPYVEYFGLSERPFGLTPDPFFYFESETHKAALDHLNFFISHREGLAVIYGNVGLGKTTISRIFAASLDSSLYNLALVLNPIMDETELLKEILQELNVMVTDGTKKELFDTLTSFLLDEHKRGKETVLMIDEAQLLSNELLEFIRVLSNVETEKEKILHIILFSQPEIVEKLQGEGMRYFAQRITVFYKLLPFTVEEIRRYINFRLIKAGSKGLLEFREGAVRLISIASQGCPRLVNMLCDRCLLSSYAQSKTVIDEETVSAVLKEQNISLATSQKEGKAVTSPQSLFSYPVKLLHALLAVLFVVLLFGGLSWYNHDFRKPPKTPAPSLSGTPTAQAPAVGIYAGEDTRTDLQARADKNTVPLSGKKQSDMANTALPQPAGDIGKPLPVAEAVVMKDAANIRIGPTIDAPRIALLFQGEKIQVFEEKTHNSGEKWYKIRLYGDREGWVSGSVVEIKHQ